MEYLLSVDKSLFIFLNKGLANPFFDLFMPFITRKQHWFPFWIVIIILLLWKGAQKGRTVVLLIIPLIFLSDGLTSSVLKPIVGRTRPCIALKDVHLTVGRKKSPSFPSAHAANFFALAAFFAVFYPKHRKWYYAVACLVAFSRISVGVHYPLDVLCGAVIGILVARVTVAFFFLYLNFRGKSPMEYDLS